MATRVVPTEWRALMARQFIDNINTKKTNYYMWIGNHIPISVTPLAFDMTFDTSTDVYRNMICGKQVRPFDVLPVIKSIPYVANTVYDRYDDGDPILYTKQFYVMVDDGVGAMKHVFKCLDNNNGTPSTYQPSFVDIDSADEFYQTSDGYLWKYMYSIDQYTYTRFSTSSSLFPVVVNTAVSGAASNGGIEVVSVDSPGSLYNNYLDGIFSASDIRYNGNVYVYGINSNNIASATPGFYTGCMLYIASGPASGEYRTIVDYYSNANGRFAVVDSEFAPIPINGSQYQIRPRVVIVGDGNQTINAVARAQINAVGNVVNHVEILNRGAGYSFATAFATANATVGVANNAVLRPIASPPGGHGYDPVVELGATAVAVSVFLANTESNTIPNVNGFRQIGLLHDPVYANVQVSLSTSQGTFIPGETVYRINGKLMQTNTIANGNSIDCSSANFNRQFVAGEFVYLVSSDNLYQALNTVSQVTNSTHLSLANTLSWACSTITVYSAQVTATAYVSNVITSNTLVLDNFNNIFTPGDMLIGTTSGASGFIGYMKRNNVRKDFSTFVQMPKYDGTLNSGNFIQNEPVYQGPSLANSTANAILHSSTTTSGNTSIYVTNQFGVFDPTKVLNGANSSAVFTISTPYSGELQPGTGRVTYLENTSMYTRNNDAWENITLKIDF